MIIANEARSAELAIYHLKSNKSERSNCQVVVLLDHWISSFSQRLVCNFTYRYPGFPSASHAAVIAVHVHRSVAHHSGLHGQVHACGQERPSGERCCFLMRLIFIFVILLHY